MTPVDSSSLPGTVLVPSRAKTAADAPTPAAVRTNRGDSTPPGDGQFFRSNSAQPGGFDWVPAVATQYITNPNPLPAVPFDGQEVYYQAAPGIIWHLRYNAASVSAQKWEFLGGAPMEDDTPVDGTLAGQPITQVKATRALLQMPLTGTYQLFEWAQCNMQPAQASSRAGVHVNGNLVNSTRLSWDAAFVGGINKFMADEAFAIVAGDTVTLKLWTDDPPGGNNAYWGVGLRLTPVTIL